MLDTAGRCWSPGLRVTSGPRSRSAAGRPRSDRPQLADRYRLLEQVGRGGVAVVWRGHDERLDREVGIKQIPRQQREPAGVDPLAEARLAARVRHPNVAAVHDVIEQDRSCWLVLDYVPGRTLGQLLRDRGPLAPDVAAGLGCQVLAALQAVHAAGIVHCDVKPANLLVGDDGRVVLVDFGIAWAGGDRPTGTSFDTEGDADSRAGPDLVVGTPAFIAPELARGERPRPAADLWSLGATLYCAVEGRPPFAVGEPASTLAAVLHDPPARSRRAGPLQPLLERLLVKDPAARPWYEEIAGLLAAARGSGPRNRPGTGPARVPTTDSDPDATLPAPGWHTGMP